MSPDRSDYKDPLAGVTANREALKRWYALMEAHKARRTSSQPNLEQPVVQSPTSVSNPAPEDTNRTNSFFVNLDGLAS